MIKADMACVQIEGNEQIIMAEFVGIIQSIRQVLTDRHGDEIAREKIARAARLAFMEEDELDELLTEALKKELEERGYEVH